MKRNDVSEIKFFSDTIKTVEDQRNFFTHNLSEQFRPYLIASGNPSAVPYKDWNQPISSDVSDQLRVSPNLSTIELQRDFFYKT